MPESEFAPQQRDADVVRLGCDVAVVIDLSRKHDKRLSQFSGRLDTHNRRLQQVEHSVAEAVLQAGLRFDHVDDRFVQVEQRLDFISGQLADLLRRRAG